MTEKFSGIDFDRPSMTQPPDQTIRPIVRLGGILFSLAVIGALAFIAYRVVQQVEGDAGSSGDTSNLTEIDNRLSDIESRLEKLELARRTGESARRNEPLADSDPAPAKPRGTTIYRVTPSPRTLSSIARPEPGAADSATDPRLSGVQQGLGAVENDESANREALQATTDRLADVAGQVGAQSVQILQSQDELNQLLSQSEREAIPFELTRGSNPVPVGPVSFILRASNQKMKRYSLCIYVQPSCIELKDKTQNEVVQFVVSRNTTPLEFVATKILKDQIVGYLEVPRNPGGR